MNDVIEQMMVRSRHSNTRRHLLQWTVFLNGSSFSQINEMIFSWSPKNKDTTRLFRTPLYFTHNYQIEGAQVVWSAGAELKYARSTED